MIVCLAVALSGVARADEANMVLNGDFAKFGKNGWPAKWSVHNSKHKPSMDKEVKPGGCEQSLMVEIAVTGKWSAAVMQNVKGLDPAKTYVVEATMRSSKPGLAYIQIKRRMGKKKLGRVTSKKSGTEWKTVTLKVTGCELAQVMCRYAQKEDVIGEKVWFANVKMSEAK
jgi:hypothetical protein